MTQESIFLPVLVLAFLTFIVLLMVGVSRHLAVRNRSMKASYFKLFQGDKPPEHITALTRNYANLFELPMLFYVGCLVLYVLNRVDYVGLYLAWAFVGLRLLHTLIHLTYNNVIHRFGVFLLSFAVLVIIWVRIAMALVG